MEDVEEEDVLEAADDLEDDADVIGGDIEVETDTDETRAVGLDQTRPVARSQSHQQRVIGQGRRFAQAPIPAQPLAGRRRHRRRREARAADARRVAAATGIAADDRLLVAGIDPRQGESRLRQTCTARTDDSVSVPVSSVTIAVSGNPPRFSRCCHHRRLGCRRNGPCRRWE